MADQKYEPPTLGDAARTIHEAVTVLRSRAVEAIAAVPLFHQWAEAIEAEQTERRLARERFLQAVASERRRLTTRIRGRRVALARHQSSARGS